MPLNSISRSIRLETSKNLMVFKFEEFINEICPHHLQDSSQDPNTPKPESNSDRQTNKRNKLFKTIETKYAGKYSKMSGIRFKPFILKRCMVDFD